MSYPDRKLELSIYETPDGRFEQFIVRPPRYTFPPRSRRRLWVRSFGAPSGARLFRLPPLAHHSHHLPPPAAGALPHVGLEGPPLQRRPADEPTANFDSSRTVPPSDAAVLAGRGAWGCHICRNIVRGHGGEIHAEANAGGGTPVVVTLPAGTPV